MKVLHPYVNDSAVRQLNLIYTLQVFSHDNNFPKGFVARGFMYLLKLVPIEPHIFVEWKMDINDDFPGKI